MPSKRKQAEAIKEPTAEVVALLNLALDHKGNRAGVFALVREARDILKRE